MASLHHAYLIVLEGTNTGKIYELSFSNVLEKRIDDLIVQYDKKLVAEKISIELRENEYWLQNPTKLDVQINEQFAKKQTRLKHGDIIRMPISLLFIKIQNSFEPFTGLEEKPEIIKYITPQNYGKILEQGLTDRTGRRLKALIEVSASISKIYDEKILLKRILSIVGKSFHADRGFIAIITVQKKCEIKTFFQRNRGQTKDYTHSKSITRKVLVHKTPMLYNPSSKKPSSPYENLSCLSVPLNCKGKLLGLIQLESFSGYKFNRQDAGQLRKIAVQTAIALDNLQKYQEPFRYQQNLIFLEKFTRTLGKHLKKEKIIEEGIKVAGSLFHSTRISILLLDKQRKFMKIVGATGIEKKQWKSTKITIKGTLAGKVLRHGKSVLISNTNRLPKTIRSLDENRAAYRSVSCILAPIQALDYGKKREKATGVICVTDKTEGTFTRLERDLLTLLANQIGTAITNAELYQKATTDLLTGVYSKGFFFQKLQSKVHHALIKTTPLALIMLDLDYFKRVNDTYTHQAGDKVLEQLGKLLKKIVGSPIIGRYGGEEFIICMEKDRKNAVEIGERIRKGIASHAFDIGEKKLHMTASIGISELQPTDTPHLLVERADKALYIAKESGRNKVISKI